MNPIKKNLSVVLVDDDEDYYYLAKEALAEAGFVDDFQWLRGGQELFELLPKMRPGLILLDLNMPKMDGYQVLDRMKATPEYRSIPVVILTTSRSEQDVVKSYDKGACSFVSKPIDFTCLVEYLKIFIKYWHEIVEIPKQGQ